MSIKALLRKLWNPKTEKAFVEETDALFYYLLADQLADRKLSRAEILQIMAILKSNVTQLLELESGIDEVLNFEGGADLLDQMHAELEPFFSTYKLSEIQLTGNHKYEEGPVSQSVRGGLSKQAQEYINRFIRRLDQRLGGDHGQDRSGLK